MYICFKLIIVFLFTLLSHNAAGQMQYKKKLTDLDYKKWGTLWLTGLSGNGNWVSFEMTYENQIDTLFIRNTRNLRQYSFPKGTDGRFVGDRIFACRIPEERMELFDLKTGKTYMVPRVSKYEVMTGGKYIVTFHKGVLEIRDKTGKSFDSIAGVMEYAVHEKTNALLYATRNNVAIIDFKKYNRYVLATLSNSAQQLTWQLNGESVTYLEKDDSNDIHRLNFISLADKKLSTFDVSADTPFKIYERPAIKISASGKQVFVKVVPKLITQKSKANVEIWNGNDNCLYPEKERLAMYGDMPNLACWNPLEDTFKLVSTNELPEVMISADADYAILSNRYSYGRLPNYYQSVDYYLKDIQSEKQQLLLKQQSHDPNQIVFAPYKNKILYYKNRNWWLYDIASDTHLNITKEIVTKWDNTSENAQNQFAVYGNPGWTVDGRSVLLYDEFDLWEISIDGSQSKRLTKGREHGYIFRIAQLEFDTSAVNYDGRASAVIDITKPILLKASNQKDWSTGYFLYNISKGEQQLVYGSKQYGQIRKSLGGFAYINETFEQPPRLEFRSFQKNGAKIVFESNKQQSQYHFGKAELLHYKDAHDHDLKAALFYPANYNPTKKYPMIVYIYDTMSKNIHYYTNPTNLNAEGFNITNYTLNDYLVLLPDISYELGNTGISAASCVIAGVKQIIEKGIVDSGKIGLIGHSFGAYETNFILTQTNLFAAAVSGAGISDNISLYFNIGKNGFAIPDMWRFESQQWRMGKSLYEDPEGYLRNSPIMGAYKVITPLLLWTGKNDRSVPMNQSISYYLALRRLGQKCIFLAYPNEDHSLTIRENQADLTQRIFDWFDHFLRGNPSEWILKGTEN